MKHARVSLFGLFSVLVAAVAAALPPVGNANNLLAVPTLEGVGLASLAGVVTMTGAWLLARRRSKKN